jgi:hypothetical protein
MEGLLDAGYYADNPHLVPSSHFQATRKLSTKVILWTILICQE